MQNTERVVRSDEEIGGGSTWTIGVAHRDSLFSGNGKHRHARYEPAKPANAKFESYVVNEGVGHTMHVCTHTNPTNSMLELFQRVLGLYLFAPSSLDWLH